MRFLRINRRQLRTSRNGRVQNRYEMNTQSLQKKSLDGVRRCPSPMSVPPIRSAEYVSVLRKSQKRESFHRPMTVYGPETEKESPFHRESFGHHPRFSVDLTSVRVHLGDVSEFFVVLLAKIRGSRYLFFTSPKRALYISLASGVAFGVFLTAITFSLFDRGVSAQSPSIETPSGVRLVSSGSEGSDLLDPTEEGNDVFLEYFSETAEEEYRAKITGMVGGYPIEEMLPYIFEKDRTVAAFLIGIAKKESNWGKRVPVLDSQDCFNYWGYRGVRRLMGTGGHTCFNSRKDAVDTVAKRIEKLVYSQKLNTPEKMILWKCGFSCEGHSRESVKKWISDVSMYFSQLDDQEME